MATNQDNLCAAASYLLGWLSGVVVYLVYRERKNKYVSFHAVQSILLCVLVMAVWLALAVFSLIVSMIPLIGGVISVLAWLGLMTLCLVLWLFLMYKAYTGAKYKLPLIGDLAEKYA